MTELSTLLLVRHGQSIGNVAVDRARDSGAHELDLEHRDADTPLSENGEAQGAAVGSWIARMPVDHQPTLWLSSPYRRAADTATLAVEAAATGATVIFDERLRERDLGLLDGYTGRGIRHFHPDEARRRDRIGKFYYRPPGGESWTDVLLRVRHLLAELRQQYPGERVCLFSHQAVIMCFRVALENLSEGDVLRIDRENPLPNCSVTSYAAGPEAVSDANPHLTLQHYADTTAVERLKLAPTEEESRA